MTDPTQNGLEGFETPQICDTFNYTYKSQHEGILHHHDCKELTGQPRLLLCDPASS